MRMRRGRGGGGRREVRWLECGRQGRGNKFPLPVSLSPRGDIPTVQHMGRTWRRARHGGPPAPPRIRFPTSSTPDTISRRLHPGHGCSPDIATHGPRPPEGGGGGAPEARVGWGCQKKRKGIPCRRCGRGGGCRQRMYGYPYGGAGRVGAAGRECMGILCRRRGRGGGCRQKGMGIAYRRRRG